MARKNTWKPVTRMATSYATAAAKYGDRIKSFLAKGDTDAAVSAANTAGMFARLAMAANKK